MKFTFKKFDVLKINFELISIQENLKIKVYLTTVLINIKKNIKNNLTM